MPLKPLVASGSCLLALVHRLAPVDRHRHRQTDTPDNYHNLVVHVHRRLNVRLLPVSMGKCLGRMYFCVHVVSADEDLERYICYDPI